jgi:hypothetical protein
LPGDAELGHLQCAANLALEGPKGERPVVGLCGTLEGLQRLLKARLVVEQRRQLELQLTVAARGALVGHDGHRRHDEDSHDHTRHPPSHGHLSRPLHPAVTAGCGYF